mmetsp:Transcript_23173/g.54797  ORF Transcript_23173/g.54797 Transcript_23173/m.54797 type:complete len:815 (-) Transcript_23173:158-2602(-)|eukprot:CAMPEP_0197185450 /NCGR_PEP_ID=MMETSP1423-20130617/11954_1 /TAXON_ID=476441 /ORGANISM="Pseudo-nitzschia heimii, Strain UNC1101" /LENGTH=814 /DNA_ID=CAMNT_0042636515 /DNA_START=72 /DNA_END=2516 /DNA_ORIENTATION=+
MQVDWEISQQFVSDSQGIRVACVLPPSDPNDGDSYRIVTGNQGGSLCEFGVPSGSLKPIAFQHDHAVTALLAPDLKNNNPGFYITGCKDNVVRVFDSCSHELKAALKGHEKPVTSMSFVPTTSDDDEIKYLVTGSWDGTAKVWDIGTNALLATLPGHENSTCVTALIPGKDQPSNIVKIATGSAGMAKNNQIEDHKVRIWIVNVKTGQVQCTNTVTDDHSGPIRDICSFREDRNQAELVCTCSNDGTVRMRSSDNGDSISVFTFLPQQSSHLPMLLSIAPIIENDLNLMNIVSSAEDGHVVAWNCQGGGGEPQIIMHPSCVWRVVGLPKGDFATCCQDGTLRIFTKASDRMAPQAEKDAFTECVQASQTKNKAGPSAEDVAKLPPWETNQLKRGTSEGQVQLFNKNNTAIAAQWSMTSQTWVEVGQVMGSADGGTIDGVQYDHVLPIEVDQQGGGVAKLQIGYNNGENQFVAAQRFIDMYMLPQHHLTEIANYIEQRVGNEGRTLGGTTGASGSNTSPQQLSTDASMSAAPTGMPISAYKHLPAPAYKSFELSVKNASTTLDKMKKKIEEFGRLSDIQMSKISNLMTTLGATNRYHSSKIEMDELKIICDMLETFPREDIFPALDLARLTVAHPHAATSSNATYWNTIICKALSLCADTQDLAGSAAIAVPMLSLRLFVNAFRGGPGSLQAVVSQLEPVLRCNEKFINSKNKNVRLSAATLLYNISLYIFKKDGNSPDIASQVVLQVDMILTSKIYETEALIRSLVALGTVAIASGKAKETAKSNYVVSRVELSASPHGDLAKALAKEVYNALT